MRACCWPAPTRSRSTPPPWRGRSSCARRPRNSAPSASWWRSTPARPRPAGGRSSPTAAARATGLDAVDWARRMTELGAGEILLTSMDRDGTKSGYDLELTRAVSDAVPVPVIASGGVGTLEHLVEGVTQGGARRCWPPRSSISASSPSPRRRNDWPRPAFQYGRSRTRRDFRVESPQRPRKRGANRSPTLGHGVSPDGQEQENQEEGAEEAAPNGVAGATSTCSTASIS